MPPCPFVLPWGLADEPCSLIAALCRLDAHLLIMWRRCCQPASLTRREQRLMAICAPELYVEDRAGRLNARAGKSIACPLHVTFLRQCFWHNVTA